MTRFFTAAALALVWASPLPAQGTPMSNTSGFSLGLSVNVSSVNSADLTDGRENGAGLGLSLGYGFTRHFSILLDGTAAAMPDDWMLSHGDLLGRWTFGTPMQQARPFVEGGFTTWMGTEENAVLDPTDPNSPRGDLELSGAGFTLGGGVHYFFSPKWAFTGDVRFTTGEFDEIKFQNVSVSGLNADATSMRLILGFNWFPMRGR